MYTIYLYNSNYAAALVVQYNRREIFPAARRYTLNVVTQRRRH